tara:strand:- start:403 stop:573 length:171 start_codon:yes stop_codon:yes gene_type:complete
MLVEVDQRIMITVMVVLPVVVVVLMVLELQHHLDLDQVGIPEKVVRILGGQVFHPL